MEQDINLFQKLILGTVASATGLCVWVFKLFTTNLNNKINKVEEDVKNLRDELHADYVLKLDIKELKRELIDEIKESRKDVTELTKIIVSKLGN